MGQHTSNSTVLLDNSGSLTRSYFTSMCCICFSEDQIPHGFPTIDMGPQLKVVELTRTATMLCAASGNPDPEIHWFKDFLPVDLTNGRIKQLRSGEAPFSLCWLSPLMFRFTFLHRIYSTVTSQNMICDSMHQRFPFIQAANHYG